MILYVILCGPYPYLLTYSPWWRFGRPKVKDKVWSVWLFPMMTVDDLGRQEGKLQLMRHARWHERIQAWWLLGGSRLLKRAWTVVLAGTWAKHESFIIYVALWCWEMPRIEDVHVFLIYSVFFGWFSSMNLECQFLQVYFFKNMMMIFLYFSWKVKKHNDFQEYLTIRK